MSEIGLILGLVDTACKIISAVALVVLCSKIGQK